MKACVYMPEELLFGAGLGPAAVIAFIPRCQEWD